MQSARLPLCGLSSLVGHPSSARQRQSEEEGRTRSLPTARTPGLPHPAYARRDSASERDGSCDGFLSLSSIEVIRPDGAAFYADLMLSSLRGSFGRAGDDDSHPSLLRPAHRCGQLGVDGEGLRRVRDLPTT